MTTPNLPIKMTDIQTEFGGTIPITLSAEYYRGGPNVPSGQPVSSQDTVAIPSTINTTIRMGMFRLQTKVTGLTGATATTPVSGGNGDPVAGTFRTATSSVSTVTPIGGSGTYTYSWSLVSGTAFSINNGTTATASFTYTSAIPSAEIGFEQFTATYKCTVTDTVSSTSVFSNNVSVSLTFTNTS